MMRETMIRTGFQQGSRVVLKDIDRPSLTPDDIRVRIDACGICGTDLQAKPDEVKEQPFGHEIAGTITEIGDRVTGLAVGQRVVLESSSACGRCANCRDARQELCLDLKTFWSSPSLGFAEEMISPAICAIPYENLTPEVACLQEPLGVAIDMVRLTDITLDSNVLLMGAGPIGLMALALAKQQGARNLFVCQRKRRQTRCQIALDWGAKAIIEPEALETYDFGCKIDRVMVTTSPNTIGAAAEIACKGGIITFIGLGSGEKGMVRFDGNTFHFKKLQLRASFAAPALYGPAALRYLREGVVDGEALISHRYPLDHLREACTTALDAPAAVKVVVTNGARTT